MAVFLLTFSKKHNLADTKYFVPPCSCVCWICPRAHKQLNIKAINNASISDYKITKIKIISIDSSALT